MSNFTQIRDLNLRILEDFDDRSLFNYCIANRYSSELCNNEGFWQRRFMKKFVDGQEEWRGEKSWKEYYLLLSHYYDIIRGIKIINLGGDTDEMIFVNEDRLSTMPSKCFTYFGVKFINLMWKLRYCPTVKDFDIGNKEEQIKTLNMFFPELDLTNFSDTKLLFYYKWNHLHVIDNLINTCSIISNILKKYNMIIQGRK